MSEALSPTATVVEPPPRAATSKWLVLVIACMS